LISSTSGGLPLVEVSWSEESVDGIRFSINGSEIQLISF